LCKTGNQLLAAADNVQPAFVLMLFEHFIEAAFKLCHLQCSPVAQWSLLALSKISSEIGKEKLEILIEAIEKAYTDPSRNVFPTDLSAN
jgi:hypothetical protein